MEATYTESSLELTQLGSNEGAIMCCGRKATPYVITQHEVGTKHVKELISDSEAILCPVQMLRLIVIKNIINTYKSPLLTMSHNTKTVPC